MRLIPALKTIHPDHLHGQFAFGIETNLSGTPAMDKLWEYISSAKENPKPYNAELAGNLFSSLVLNDTDNWFFVNTCIPIIGKYKEFFKKTTAFNSQSISKNDLPYGLDNFWVNFQKQHEFNPPHNHGGIWSFVIWVKIPTDFREQHALPFSASSNMARASDFEFQYTTMLGDITGSNYCLDKKSEGQMLFFPAKLLHTVYPFYECDKERVSISGNIHFER